MTPSADAPLVLVVEDYDDAREMYAAYLRLDGFRVEEAGDGVEALRLAAALAPDAIVMDLSLPVVDGFETIRRLRQAAGHERHSHRRAERVPGGAGAGRRLERLRREAVHARRADWRGASRAGGRAGRQSIVNSKQPGVTSSRWRSGKKRLVGDRSPAPRNCTVRILSPVASYT